MTKFHYEVIHKLFENKSCLIYSDTAILVYNIRYDDIYEWIKQNREHFDLSDSFNGHMRDNTNEHVLKI